MPPSFAKLTTILQQKAFIRQKLLYPTNPFIPFPNVASFLLLFTLFPPETPFFLKDLFDSSRSALLTSNKHFLLPAKKSKHLEIFSTFPEYRKYSFPIIF